MEPAVTSDAVVDDQDDVVELRYLAYDNTAHGNHGATAGQTASLLGKRLFYDGTSRRTERRRRLEKAVALASCPMQPLTAFWSSLQPIETPPSAKVHIPFKSDTQAVDALQASIEVTTTNTSQFVKMIALLNFSKSRVDCRTREASAARASEALPSTIKVSGRTIQNWARVYVETGKVPEEKCGKHQKTASLIHDEDVLTKCIDWLRAQKPPKRTPQHFQAYLVDTVLPLATGAVAATVSESTARRWMLRVGYKYGAWHKDVYVDGHERSDVLVQRETFCTEWLGLYDRMRSFSGEKMETDEPPVDSLAPEVVWVTHDESVFYANDDGGLIWSCTEHPDLPKKSRGRSVMASDFLCACHGRLFNVSDNKKEFVTEILHIGKNQDGYWTSEHVVHQVHTKAIPAFVAMHPNAIALFCFDQSTNHAAFANDALRARNMNLGPGGKQPRLRHGWFGADKTRQDMTFASDHPDEKMRGAPKGLKITLAERGINVDGMRLQCKFEVDFNATPDLIFCCARHCMASHEDFRGQRSILEETITGAGFLCLFYPKFHCEWNPIESYWGAAKRYARAECDYSWEGLIKCVPKSLANVQLVSIRKFFRRCAHFIQSYSYGCDYALTKFAHKRYKSHRRIPKSVLHERPEK